MEEGKEVKYITERAVFKLTEKGLALMEIAPGVDLEKDVLAKMEFRPIVAEVSEIERKIYCDGRMGLREEVVKAIKA